MTNQLRALRAAQRSASAQYQIAEEARPKAASAQQARNPEESAQHANEARRAANAAASFAEEARRIAADLLADDAQYMLGQSIATAATDAAQLAERHAAHAEESARIAALLGKREEMTPDRKEEARATFANNMLGALEEELSAAQTELLRIANAEPAIADLLSDLGMVAPAPSAQPETIDDWFALTPEEEAQRAAAMVAEQEEAARRAALPKIIITDLVCTVEQISAPRGWSEVETMPEAAPSFADPDPRAVLLKSIYDATQAQYDDALRAVIDGRHYATQIAMAKFTDDWQHAICNLKLAQSALETANHSYIVARANARRILNQRGYSDANEETARLVDESTAQISANVDAARIARDYARSFYRCSRGEAPQEVNGITLYLEHRDPDALRVTGTDYYLAGRVTMGDIAKASGLKIYDHALPQSFFDDYQKRHNGEAPRGVWSYDDKRIIGEFVSLHDLLRMIGEQMTPRPASPQHEG